MNREPTLEQQARFERLCFALTDDIQANAYRAAIKAGYTLRMAKSKSYNLASRAWKGRSLGSDGTPCI